MPKPAQYRGRFAPSSTGKLHLGSLYAAVASFLEARSHQGQWLLRIDDLDHLRNVKGAADDILRTLEAFGLHWDETVYYQSQYQQTYQHIVEQLQHQHKAYPCTCTRKVLTALDNQGIYPRFCLHKPPSLDEAHALRIKTNSETIRFNDGIQGQQSYHLQHQAGDFIIKRKDNIIAYQLAVVIDDELQHITDVVRGLDLLDSTPKQLYLQQLLGYSTPKYWHVPILTDAKGNKLSKQTFAQGIDKQHPEISLFYVLTLLNQNPPAELNHAPVAEILDWAMIHWHIEALKKSQTQIPVSQTS